MVLSPASYNARAGMIVCCPVTTRIKGYPFEVALAGTPPTVVLADQVKSQDWRARQATRKGQVTAAELAEVRAKLRALSIHSVNAAAAFKQLPISAVPC